MATRHSVAILGSSGFAGRELLRILDCHPGVTIVSVGAFTQAGRKVGTLYPGLSPALGEMAFVENEAAAAAGAEILLSSLPHTKSMRLLSDMEGTRVIDLGGDFRIKSAESYREWYREEHLQPDSLADWVYGLTELRRDQIRSSHRVANPGCYAAAVLLALAPLIESQLIETDYIHIDAKSGISGAGRAGGETLDFTRANENVRPYSPTMHKHIVEIEQELGALGGDVKVTFVPHLVPMTRGVLVTCLAVATEGSTERDLLGAMVDRYSNEPFVRVLAEESLPETARLSGTNVAEISARLDERTGRAIVFAALDNLGKGAAGQAVQNMNVMLGCEETTSLPTAGVLP